MNNNKIYPSLTCVYMRRDAFVCVHKRLQNKKKTQLPKLKDIKRKKKAK